jgi:hypothetical protein
MCQIFHVLRNFFTGAEKNLHFYKKEAVIRYRFNVFITWERGGYEYTGFQEGVK